MPPTVRAAEIAGPSLAVESDMADLPAPKTGFVLTHFITVSDIKRSTYFYRDILGGEVVLEGEPTLCQARQQ